VILPQARLKNQLEKNKTGNNLKNGQIHRIEMKKKENNPMRLREMSCSRLTIESCINSEKRITEWSPETALHPQRPRGMSTGRFLDLVRVLSRPHRCQLGVECSHLCSKHSLLLENRRFLSQLDGGRRRTCGLRGGRHG
jgi:hypothetical protein